MGSRESELIGAAIEFLTYTCGAFVWRNNTGAAVSGSGDRRRFWRFGKRGAPDIIGCAFDGRMIGIEVKTGRTTLTPDQRAFIEELRTRGAIAGVIRSLDDLEEILQDANAFKT